MAKNFVETIQTKLGYPPLQKIDPNIQEAKKGARSQQERLAQAAIPAVLTALYSFTRSDEGSQAILAGEGYSGWLPVIFPDKENTAVGKVAQYAGVTEETAAKEMEKIADEAVAVLRKEAGEHPTPEKIRATMDTERHHILVTLPAAMQMGDLLHEETLDDRTNKMEGPVSNFLHKIENFLSKGDESKYP
jgi:hypothetical protein